MVARCKKKINENEKEEEKKSPWNQIFPIYGQIIVKN